MGIIDFNSGDKKTNKWEHEERICRNCGRKILYTQDLKADLCPKCRDQELFYQVKDYIRANDVKDYDVAKHFGIPLSKVNEWIKQGRIQYKDDPSMKAVIMGNYCEVCGSPVAFGTVCPSCMKAQKKAAMKGVSISEKNIGDNKMRFMDDE